MIFLFKWLKVMAQTQEIAGIELWYVRWKVSSRYGEILNFVEAFPVEADAENFAASLREAFKLIKYKTNSLSDSNDGKVTVGKQ